MATLSKYDDYNFPLATSSPGHYGNLSTDQEAALHDLRTHLEEAKFTERLDTLSLVLLTFSLLDHLFNSHGPVTLLEEEGFLCE